jgi:radical SAM superfamily enzyme YgiQ (UPF0313 family)
MNILLISANRNVLPLPVMPIGACMVAEAAERAGHDVRLLDLMFEREPVAAVEDAVVGFRPDVVGLSVRNIDNNDMRDPVFFLADLPLMVNTVREHTGAPIILGGAALGVMPEAILRHTGVSCGVIGDGEIVFPLLLERIAEGEPFGDVPGIAYLDHDGFNATRCIDAVAGAACGAPAYGRWVDIAAYRSQLATVPVQTKLGCPFRCVYCTYRKIDGTDQRLADPGSIAGAVRQLAASGLRDIEFVDSVFNAPREHALDVCEALSRTGHQARLQSLELNPRSFDDELVAAMKRAGFVGMGLTAESAADRVLEGLGKGFTSREVHHAAEVVKRGGIPCAWIFLLGGPGETRETVRETLRFAERNVRSRDVAFFNVGIRIYPGTELESIARREGVLTVPPEAMLRPVFYVAPEVEASWIMHEVKRSMADHMNFISADSIGLPFLPTVHRFAYRLGVRPPLWRHTRRIRRGLRMLGMDV